MTKRLHLFMLAPLALVVLIGANRLRPAKPAPSNAVQPTAAAPVATEAPSSAPAPETKPQPAPAVQELTPPPAEPAPAEKPTAVSLAGLAATKFDGRDLVIGAVQATTATYVRHYITYKSGDLTISGTFAIPKGKGPFPLVVQNHGYIDPKIYTNGRGLRREQDYMASRGFAVLHTDYRGHAQSTKDGDSELKLRLGYAIDSINAVYAVRAAKLPNVDASKVGMLGHSMGGGVTMQTITAVPGLLNAAVLFAPVSGDARDNFNKWTKSRPETAAEIVERFGSPETAPEFWDGVSPIKHFDKVQTPVLLHHGTADESCAYDWALKLDEAFNAAGKDALMTFHGYEGQPHEFTTAWPLVMQRTVAFFDEHLKSKE